MAGHPVRQLVLDYPLLGNEDFEVRAEKFQAKPYGVPCFGFTARVSCLMPKLRVSSIVHCALRLQLGLRGPVPPPTLPRYRVFVGGEALRH